MHIFDIIGPVMIGPSSSHTAGAAKIGYVTRKLTSGSGGNSAAWFFFCNGFWTWNRSGNCCRIVGIQAG